MAPVAIGAELPSMAIVSTVAGNANRRLRCGFSAGRSMAGSALEVLMRSRQWKIRLRIMTKCPQRPGSWVVAVGAILAEASFMDIIIRMAGAACCFGGPEFLVEMARAALDRLVFSKKREGAEVMIKAEFGGPRDFVVAGCAIIALAALVRIVLPVTIDARISGQRLCHGFEMARLASYGFMGALQLEFRSPVMVKPNAGPCARTMTVRATRSISPLMSVIILVACDARHLQLRRRQARRVTCRAVE